MVYLDLQTVSGNDSDYFYTYDDEAQTLEVSVSVDSSELLDLGYDEPLSYEVVSLILLGAILGAFLSFVLFRRFR